MTRDRQLGCLVGVTVVAAAAAAVLIARLIPEWSARGLELLLRGRGPEVWS